MSERTSLLLPANANELLAEFLKLLSHELRSPLSVMANDLQYLVIPDADQSISTWKGALSRMTEDLETLKIYSSSESGSTQFSASLLLQQLAKSVIVKAAVPAETCVISGNSQLVIAALNQLLTLHLAAEAPILILNSREATMHLIPPDRSRNRQPSALVTAGFTLNQAAAPLKLWHAELVLRLGGATFSIAERELIVSLPLDGYTPRTDC